MMWNMQKKEKIIFCVFLLINKSGIGLEDCEKVNDAIMDLLDEADYIKEAYFLEISSPGIERVIRKEKHLQDNIGNEIVIHLFKPIEKEKQVEGILKEYTQKTIQIETNGKEITVERKNIALIKTKYHWEE